LKREMGSRIREFGDEGYWKGGFVLAPIERY